MNIGKIAPAAVLAAALLFTTAAAEPPSPRTLALAAGYKAAFLCSDIFNAGRTEAQATADDLTGIYKDYQPLVGTLPATIDRQAHTVSVAFDAKLPPRVAAWRPLLGCAQLPIGADPANVARLPRLDLTKPDLDVRPWPLGDAKATAKRSPALDRVVAAAFDRATYGKGSETTAVIVLVDGRIVAERYRADWTMHTPQRTWSVAKSLAATLVGRAVALGKVAPTDRIGAPEWAAPGDPRAGLTFDQTLRMHSGLWTNGPGSRTDAIYIGGATVPEDAATRPLEYAPDSHFRYANVDILSAAYGLKLRLRDDNLAFPFRELLWPLGMTRTTPETDAQGNFVLSSQIWTTARDVARLALMYQRGGTAPDGTRLLTEDWIRYVSTKQGAQPDSEATGGRGYGAGFWVMGSKDGLPAGTYSMDGNRGQYAVIVPERRVIVVRRGFDGIDAPFDPMAFTRAVLEVIPTPGTRTR